MKYRKNPIVVDAVQWFKDGDHPAVVIDPVINEGDGKFICRTHAVGAYIRTLEGLLHVSAGDWIIAGINGEHYPCKPDIFELTYEPV